MTSGRSALRARADASPRRCAREIVDASAALTAERHRSALAVPEIHGVARAIYRALPGDAELWYRGREFEVVEPAVLDRALRRHAAPACG